MEQKWRVYNSDGHCSPKAEFRNMFFEKKFLGISQLEVLTKDDCHDDAYIMDVSGEEVLIIARSRGQVGFTEEVFKDKSSGIFYRVSDENYRKAEGVLAGIFK